MDNMTSEQWEIVKELFSRAQTVATEERDDFLNAACRNNPAIKEAVRDMLEVYREDDSFLEESPVAEVASFLEEEGFTVPNGRSGETLPEGAILDKRYEILELLGRGGMGDVYLANDQKIDRNVALKVLPLELTEQTDRLQRFMREARAVSALNHPTILTIFEFGKSEDGTSFIAAEYVDGWTLNEYVAMKSPGPLRILEIAQQVTSALIAAHEEGIIHRDIKPENIMVRRDGYIKVLDFGLAKLIEADDASHRTGLAAREGAATNPGAIMGTAAYMSPEQARGQNIDARTDVWSLGVVLYEIFAGRRPFDGPTPADTIVSVLKTDPPPLASLVTDIPDALSSMIAKMLSKERDHRHRSLSEVQGELQRIAKLLESDSVAWGRRLDGYPEAERNESATLILEHIPTDPDGPELSDHTEHGHRTDDGARVTNSFAGIYARSSAGRWLYPTLLAFLSISLAVVGYLAFFGSPFSARIDSIAILPFESPEGDEELANISEGLSQNLIDRLSALDQLKVIARSSSSKFKGSSQTVQSIAGALGVRALVTGKIERSGDNLMIRVDVVDGSENRQIWGGNFASTPAELLAAQDDIARKISDSLQLRLSDAERSVLADGGTRNPEAWRYYLNGLVEVRGPQDVRGKALDNFLKAVELDPNFAEAHTELSFIYSGRASGSGDPMELMPKAKAAALRAIEIDPGLASAHVALATVREYEFDWRGAEESYRIAIELNPNLDIARDRYAFFLSVMGRHAEASRQNEESMVRDPVNVRLHLIFKGNNLVQARKFDEAIKTLKEAQKMEQGGNTLYFDVGYALAGKGLFREAAEEFRKSVEVLGGEDKYSQPLVYLATAYANIPEKRADAVKIAGRLAASDEHVSPALMAALYIALGEDEKAISELEKAYEQKDVLLRFIKVGYEYDGLRQDPRFKEILVKTGLSERVDPVGN